jgi:hypothetical protein
MASAAPVTDHDEIRQWVESRGGRPACVKGTAALLRVDFGEPDAKLQPIDWDQWFETFDSRRLAALIQEEGSSRFIKLVSRGAAGTRGAGSAKGTRAGAKRAGAGARRTAASNRGGRSGRSGDEAGGGRGTRLVVQTRTAGKPGSTMGRSGTGSTRQAANASAATRGGGRKAGGASGAARKSAGANRSGAGPSKRAAGSARGASGRKSG